MRWRRRGVVVIRLTSPESRELTNRPCAPAQTPDKCHMLCSMCYEATLQLLHTYVDGTICNRGNYFNTQIFVGKTFFIVRM